jgi:hypothetical protein
MFPHQNVHKRTCISPDGKTQYNTDLHLVIKSRRMAGALSMHGGMERDIQYFGGNTWVKETTWKTQALMER